MLLKNKRIFFVEDNVANKSIMMMILEMAGAKVEFERTGTAALDHLKQFAPVDLILLDLMLPYGSSGYTLYEAIRAEPEFAKAIIVAVSATNPSEAIPKAKGMGFAGFISKPVDQILLPLQLGRILDGENLWLNGRMEA